MRTAKDKRSGFDSHCKKNIYIFYLDIQCQPTVFLFLYLTHLCVSVEVRHVEVFTWLHFVFSSFHQISVPRDGSSQRSSLTQLGTATSSQSNQNKFSTG